MAENSNVGLSIPQLRSMFPIKGSSNTSEPHNQDAEDPDLQLGWLGTCSGELGIEITTWSAPSAHFQSCGSVVWILLAHCAWRWGSAHSIPCSLQKNCPGSTASTFGAVGPWGQCWQVLSQAAHQSWGFQAHCWSHPLSPWVLKQLNNP